MQRKVRRLWADSICINQDDIEEQNLHVAQMRSIYAAARETTIYIGDATEGSNVLLHAIEEAAISNHNQGRN